MHLFDGLGDKIWTLQEASAALDYLEDDVRQRAERGLIPSFRIDNELMFSKAELESWVLRLSSRKAEAEPDD